MKKDIRYVPTPDTVVDAMLDMGNLCNLDLLLDLGCGDGRIPIRAAQRGATAIGVDIDPRLIARSRANAISSGTENKVDFQVQNLFEAELSKVTIVTLYLGHQLNRRLQPKLQSELRPGSRIVSHSFPMIDWEPDAEVEFETKLLYVWTVRK